MLMNSQYIIKVLKVESIRKICCVPRRNTGKTSADKPETKRQSKGSNKTEAPSDGSFQQRGTGSKSKIYDE
ncbi:hypothetical protein T08_3439 [Trichinella sp. T8]|nr:hypothetical protein T08_3439 [Trichinella sp. T8]